jgi:hypothetical protein
VGSTARWGEAEIACTERGPGWNLAAVSSPEERDYFDAIDLVPVTQAWIGGHDPNGDDAFEWTNGEPWDFAPWYSTNPDLGPNCVTFFPLQGPDGFTDKNCGSFYPSVCELTPAGG